MNPDIEQSLAETHPADFLPWGRPQVTKLVVHLDTQGFGGTEIDAHATDPGEEEPSDLRLKTDIAGIKDALQGILALKGVTYRYDAADHPEMNLGRTPQIGFIAQELEKVYPEVVKTKENGFKAVNYAHLVPVLVEAIKEQQSMIEDLRQQVKELRKG